MEIFTVAVAKIMRMARMEPTEFPPPLICLNISVLAKSLPGETRNIMEPKAVMDEVKIWAKLDAKIGADMEMWRNAKFKMTMAAVPVMAIGGLLKATR